MGLYPIRNLVQVTCKRCMHSFIAKRVDTKYCLPCRKVVKEAQTTESRNRRRNEVNQQARERTKRLTDAQKQQRLEGQRRRRWSTKFGFTEADYQALLNKQDNKCAICEIVLVKPHIDHCHTTNRVRGLLCSSCNFGIGSLQDNPTILQRAAEYVALPTQRDS